MSNTCLYQVSMEEGQYRPDQKIRMIKDYRYCFLTYDALGSPSSTMSLKDAKEDCDLMMYGERISKTLTQSQINALTEIGFVVSGDGIQKPRKNNIGIYVPNTDGTRSKIQHIKNLRWALGIGLKEAKDIIEEIFSVNRHIEIKNLSQRKIERLVKAGFDVRGYTREHFESEENLFKI